MIVYNRALDALGGLLDGPRARGAFALRSVMRPPWSLRIRAESPVTLMAMLKGHAWVVPDHGSPVHLTPGDIAVARGPLSTIVRKVGCSSAFAPSAAFKRVRGISPREHRDRAEAAALA